MPTAPMARQDIRALWQAGRCAVHQTSRTQSARELTRRLYLNTDGTSALHLADGMTDDLLRSARRRLKIAELLTQGWLVGARVVPSA